MSAGSLAGRNVLISGAGRGLGEAIAAHLASLGAVVAVCDINEEAAAEVAARIISAGGEAVAYGGDLGAREVFHETMAAFARAYGPVDTLINNASYLVYEPIERVTEETLDRMIASGLKSVFWGVQAFLAHRDPEASKGWIINYSSPVAYRGRPNTGAYTAIKGAVAALTNVLAGELGPRGIRVNAIAPGSVPTPATAGFVSAEDYERRAAGIPLRRNGRPEDVARAVAFLIGEDADFINGAMLAIDGGIIAAG
ncbi:glucose 1-dehydrogenase [Sphingobium lignivorans]|uniref:NAD(P)-dependent dehydrogenase (Short-subunit alcohol dehydrogenase family) n=1 Tax=Sphingobium lignivorans TaxID=2735886 RepID=A0ABR6NF34_9SPHN|nr:NAD(P)-dependent dehydrogenase (short-subunit alcohol dehydrogenase family) [Sphingobium lignivorans]